METIDLKVAHIQRIKKAKCFVPDPIFFATFLTATEMKIPGRSTHAFPIVTNESVHELFLDRLEAQADISWHGGKKEWVFFGRNAVIHICNFALQCHGLRPRSNIHVLRASCLCCLYY